MEVVLEVGRVWPGREGARLGGCAEAKSGRQDGLGGGGEQVDTVKLGYGRPQRAQWDGTGNGEPGGLEQRSNTTKNGAEGLWGSPKGPSWVPDR